MMTKETVRIADQMRRAIGGEAWHGPPLREILSGVTAAQANGRPLATLHTIHELVLHIEVYASGALRAAEGDLMPKIYSTDLDWRTPRDASHAVWAESVALLFDAGERLTASVEAFPNERLGDTVPGRQYDFYYLFHGIVQHSLYHGGQIAILKRAASA
jgi:DinB superfamily